MLQYVSSSQLVLLTITIALKTVLAVVLVYRHHWQSYPLFTVLSIVWCGKSWILFHALSGSAEDYFFLYWQVTVVADAAILFAVIEIIWDVLLPGQILSLRVMRYFSFVVLTLVASVCVFDSAQVPTAHPNLNAAIAFDRASSHICCAVISAVLLFSSLFSVRWRSGAKFIAGGICALLVTSVIVIPASQYFLTLTRSVSVAFSLMAEAVVYFVWVKQFAVVARPVSQGGETAADLLRLLEFGKELKKEAEIL